MLHLGSGECLFFFLQSQANLTLKAPSRRFPRLHLHSLYAPPALSGETGLNQQLRDGAWKQFYFCRKIRTHYVAGSDTTGERIGSFVRDVLLKRNNCDPPAAHSRDRREGETVLYRMCL